MMNKNEGKLRYAKAMNSIWEYSEHWNIKLRSREPWYKLPDINGWDTAAMLQDETMLIALGCLDSGLL